MTGTCSNPTLRETGPRRLIAVAGVVLLLSGGCSAPPYTGFQLQDPPDGFLYDPDFQQEEVLFPDREVVVHGAWWKMNPTDEHATIAVTHFRGPGTIEEVEAAREASSERIASEEGGNATQLQFLRIDGREAWGWEEHYPSGEGLSALAYRTVVLYDTAMVALEFHSDMEEWMDPAAQKTVLLSFGLGQIQVLWGWVIALLILGAVAIGGFLHRVSKTADRPLVSTDYELLTIAPDEEGAPIGEEEVQEEGSPDAGIPPDPREDIPGPS